MSVPIRTALKALEAVERELSKLYAWLAESFQSDAELSSLFFHLAREERSHQTLVNYQQRLAQANPDAFGAVEIDLGLAGELTNQVISFRRDHPTPSPDDALKAALAFETHAAEHLHRAVAVQAQPELAEVIAKLGSDDAKHGDVLLKFIKARTNR